MVETACTRVIPNQYALTSTQRENPTEELPMSTMEELMISQPGLSERKFSSESGAPNPGGL